MSEPEVESAPGTSSGLRRGLSSRQISMLTLGGSLGTGLFLGAGLAVSLAGPAVIIAYVIGALITLAMVYASAEMAVAHPDDNGFGQLAHRYLGPLVGFSTRWMFWAAVSLVMGVETVAVGIYLALGTAAISGVSVFVNGFAVRRKFSKNLRIYMNY